MNKLFRYSFLVAGMVLVSALFMLSSCSKQKLDLKDFYSNSYSPDQFEIGYKDSTLVVETISDSMNVEDFSAELAAFFKKHKKENNAVDASTIDSAAKTVAKIVAKFQNVFMEVGSQSNSAVKIKIRYDSLQSTTVDIASQRVVDTVNNKDIDVYFNYESFQKDEINKNENYGRMLGSIFGNPASQNELVCNTFTPVPSMRLVRFVKKADEFFPRIAQGAIGSEPSKTLMKQFLIKFGENHPDMIVKIRFYKW